MRKAVVVMMTFALTLFVATPAEALCVSGSLRDVIAQSNSVWWGTVTAAAPASGSGPGEFALTIKVDQVLKGPAVDVGTVFVSPCGFYIIASQKAASTYVGRTELFLLTRTNAGQLVRYSGLIMPQISEQIELAKARRILGVGASVSTAPSTVMAPSHGVQFAIGGLVAAILIGALAWFLRRRRQGGVTQA